MNTWSSKYGVSSSNVKGPYERVTESKASNRNSQPARFGTLEYYNQTNINKDGIRDELLKKGAQEGKTFNDQMNIKVSDPQTLSPARPPSSNKTSEKSPLNQIKQERGLQIISIDNIQKQDSLIRDVNELQKITSKQNYVQKEDLLNFKKQFKDQFKKAMLDEVHETLQTFKTKEMFQLRNYLKTITSQLSFVRSQQLEIKTRLDRNHSMTENIYNQQNKKEANDKFIEEEKKEYCRQTEKIKNIAEHLEKLFNSKLESPSNGYERESSSKKEENSFRKEDKERIALLQKKLAEEKEKNERLEENKKKLEQNISQLTKVQEKNITLAPTDISSRDKSIFLSPILSLSDIQKNEFLKKSIEDFTNLKIDSCQLIFKKDQYNNNFSNYLNTDPFPYIIIMESTSGVVFGAFGEGIQTNFSESWRKRKGITTKFKAFLFNLQKSEIFKNVRATRSDSLSFKDGFLRFGNNEIILRNEFLNSVKVYSGKIFGESYYYVKSRESLIGQNKEEVPLKKLQIHKVKFQE